MLKGYLNKSVVEAGCDEAGRGCLAGPVFAAAVILPKNIRLPLLNDSKKLSESIRNKLRISIEKKAIAWSVASCTEEEIDEINILNASILAMQKAVRGLAVKPEHLLIDGNRFKPFDDYSYTTVIKGDGKFKAIAAASILAKTHRDEYMQGLHHQYPVYDFEHNKGYGTAKHREAIKVYGYTSCHRKSFKLKNVQLNLF
jgi:ribonuclease HII